MVTLFCQSFITPIIELNHYFRISKVISQGKCFEISYWTFCSP
jgi:hypothetical protein